MDDTTTPDGDLTHTPGPVEKRLELRNRHAHAITSLMEERADLRGVHALADHFAEAVRWSA